MTLPSKKIVVELLKLKDLYYMALVEISNVRACRNMRLRVHIH